MPAAVKALDSAAAILPAVLDMPLTYWVAHYGWAAVFIGALLEGETVVLLAAVLAQQGLLTFNAMLVAAALGAFAGDQFFRVRSDHAARGSGWWRR